MTKIKKPIVISLILVFALSLAGCSKYEYKGNYPELYTVAINSIFGLSGSSPGEWVPFPVFLKPWEEDEFGRQMFIYCEGSIYFLLISQASDEEYAYYYDDYNFTHVDVGDYPGSGGFGYKEIDDPKTLFSDEAVEQLKIKNDWGKEIDKSNCVKAEIVRIKKKPEIKKKVFEKLLREVAVERTGWNLHRTKALRFANYFTSDDYGRTICSVSGTAYGKEGKVGILASDDHESIELYLLIIFNPDGSYDLDTCVMDLENLKGYNYQDELKAFKEINNWNKPWK